MDSACFVVKQGGGQKLAYVYLRGGARPGSSSAKLLTRDEARRIAARPFAYLASKLGIFGVGWPKQP